jgi:hypothetical protein
MLGLANALDERVSRFIISHVNPAAIYEGSASSLGDHGFSIESVPRG